MRPLWLLIPCLLAIATGQDVTETFKDEAVTVGKSTCTCSLNLVVQGKNCKKGSSGECNEDCSGKVKKIKLTGESGNIYKVNLKVKKGNVKVTRCKAKLSSTPKPTDAPTPRPTGSPVGVIEEDEIKILQTWNQEPEGYNRTAVVQIPDSTNGKKFPVVIDLHGSGGHGTLNRFGRTFADIAVLVAPSGYGRQWNVNADRSKTATTAPDVEFILELLEVIRVGIPSADMDDVTIVGSSMGGAMLQRLLIEVPAPLPFHRAIPLYGMINTDQYHDGQFWMSSDEETLPYDVPVEPATPGPEFIYFHGDKDTVVTYWGGPGIASNVFLGAQNATYTWAEYWGERGPQLLNEEGIVLDSGMVEYRYLDGKVVHYKLPGAKHNLGSYAADIKNMIKDRVVGL